MRTWSVCVLLGLAVFLTPAARADEIAAVNMDGGWVGINGWAWYVGYTDLSYGIQNEAAAQEFIVSKSGALTTITASVDKFYGGDPLIVSVFTAVNRRPGVLLGRVAVPDSQVNSFTTTPLNTFDLSSQGIQLTAGAHYIVTFTVAKSGAVRYRAILNAPNINSFGIPNLRSTDGGITWATYANVTPEVGLVVSVATPPPPPPPITFKVAIDVIPGSTDNFVNLTSRKPAPLPVAVFGSNEFDVNRVVINSLYLGDPTLTDPNTGDGYPVPPVSVKVGDVNGDGLDDLQLTFDVTQMKAFGAINTVSTQLRLDAKVRKADYPEILDSAYGFDAVSTNKGKGGNKR